MSSLDVLHLANFQALHGKPFMTLLSYLQESGYSPQGLVLTGVTEAGKEAQLIEARVNLTSLLSSLKLSGENVMILPSGKDLSGGYSRFDLLFEVITGKPYRYENTQLLNLDQKLQLFGIDTTLYERYPVTDFQFNIRVKDAKMAASSAIRIACYVDPINWQKFPAIKDACLKHQIPLGIHGQRYSRIVSPHYTALGIDTLRCNYIRFVPHVHLMTAIHSVFSKGRWKETKTYDFDVSNQEQLC